MNEKPPLILPANEAGIRAYEVIKEVAERIWATAQELTAVFAKAAMPGGYTTIGESFSDDKYLRQVVTADGKHETVAYDYHTKAVYFYPSAERIAE